LTERDFIGLAVPQLTTDHGQRTISITLQDFDIAAQDIAIVNIPPVSLTVPIRCPHTPLILHQRVLSRRRKLSVGTIPPVY
jgi:hypothetical protein